MVTIDKESSVSLAVQIYEALIEDMKEGHIQSGDFLPSSRTLAHDLGVSRNTVNHAYSQLVAEGFVVARPQNGYQVSDVDLNYLRQEPLEIKDQDIQEVPHWIYDFSYGSIDQKHFPYREWRKCLSMALDAIEYETIDEQAIQKSLAKYLYTNRGIKCQPRQIIMTSGHQYSMNLIASLTKRTHCTLAMEDPGYTSVRSIFERRGFDIADIPVTKEGISVQELSRSHAHYAYVTPSHQFPLGHVMTLKHRIEILKWAKETSAFIIEDDYDSELRYNTQPIPSLYSLDKTGCVIYTGTFSKILSKNLRVGYIVLPPSLLDAYEEIYKDFHGACSLVITHALSLMIDSGYYSKHINRMRTLYRQESEKLKDAFYDVFPKRPLLGDDAGLHYLMEITNSEYHKLSQLKQEGFFIQEASSFFHKNDHPYYLMIGFAHHHDLSYEDMLFKLKEVLQ